MIADAQVLGRVAEWVAPWVWRRRRKVASKLLGFSATEAGSALDMLKAAELCPDPRLRRQFFRHALDEARHARLFKEQARRVDPAGTADAYAGARATRQNLYQGLELTEFITFVHLAEARGRAHFAALARHFAKGAATDPERAELASLFAAIELDERVHVAYTGRVLERWRAEGRGAAVLEARIRVRWRGAWSAWRRAGRRLGDAIAAVFLGLLYLLVVPLFALAAKREAAASGWRAPTCPELDHRALRSQF